MGGWSLSICIALFHLLPVFPTFLCLSRRHIVWSFFTNTLWSWEHSTSRIPVLGTRYRAHCIYQGSGFLIVAEEKSLSWPWLSSPQPVGLGSIKVAAAGNGTKQCKGPIIRGQHHQAGTQTVHGKNNPSHSRYLFFFLVILATFSQGGEIIHYLSSLRKISGWWVVKWSC